MSTERHVHPGRDPVIEETGFRLSWGGVLAGFLVAFAVQVVLAVLGVAIGLSSWSVGESLGGVGMVAGVWAVLSALIALFAGGAVAARGAGILTLGDGMLHGLLVWALSLLAGIWIALSGAGFLLGGVFDMVGRTASAAVSGGARVVSSVGGELASGADGLDLDVLRSEVEAMLRQTGDPALRPDSLAALAGTAGDSLTDGASNEEVAREIGALAERTSGELDRNDVLNVLTARTGLDRAEAERVADRVTTLYADASRQASTRLDTLQSQVSRTATGAAEDVENAAQAGSWWLLGWLLVSAGAAAGGAALTARS